MLGTLYTCHHWTPTTNTQGSKHTSPLRSQKVLEPSVEPEPWIQRLSLPLTGTENHSATVKTGCTESSLTDKKNRTPWGSSYFTREYIFMWREQASNTHCVKAKRSSCWGLMKSMQLTKISRIWWSFWTRYTCSCSSTDGVMKYSWNEKQCKQNRSYRTRTILTKRARLAKPQLCLINREKNWRQPERIYHLSILLFCRLNYMWSRYWECSQRTVTFSGQNKSENCLTKEAWVGN